MKAIAVCDVLSHWCYVGYPAFEALVDELGAENVQLLLGPVQNGFPMGIPVEREAWS